MSINWGDYEDVATLNKRFIANFPMGRSDIEVLTHDAKEGHILIKARVWRDTNDLQPAASNIAFGTRDLYIANMRKFYVEDTATSALGRAIIILLGSDKTATKDDMRKVDDAPIKNIYGKSGNSQLIEIALRKSFADDAKSTGDPQPWSVGEASEVLQQAVASKPKQQECAHGLMILKEGTAKTGKPYLGYVCAAPKPDQCAPVWGKLTASGNWFFEGGE